MCFDTNGVYYCPAVIEVSLFQPMVIMFMLWPMVNVLTCGHL